ncbi:putative cell wall alpha-1, 3-glucan synthase [Microdochium trichocladiopsis]|uniref:alpha-1,3-glucan synthase n=1 Tax=Microdochium trichocladiopsis TaxID=1682393 RepID=A0A9P8XPT2_9PEZI|nr:putative cell wall alpha-1, 3-glucan synthase [Microdochium trichocladiopsis]KAH7010584.1 putative cell wall alpha-1, 3-glucan synthase [Microdochium trichocladiopsis]
MAALLLTCALAVVVQVFRFDPAYVDYNLNQNKDAVDPLDYSAERPGHTYFPSPSDWRFPFYTLFLDRLANGDPTNDDINGTVYEQDITSNQLRHGGDLRGLVDSLDYIQGMGMKGIYIAGSPFINLPWGVDSYSPVDLTLLDLHYGTIREWQDMVDAVHKRGMYVMIDHTMSTMSDLLAFKGFENITATFQVEEHNVNYKGSRQYLDFQPSNVYLEKCDYPRFWDVTGKPVGRDVTDLFKGCYNSDFDQYGDIEAFGVFPDWQRSLAKFASVQDRLREWKPSVRNRIALFSCLSIIMLDVDGFRFDKATQITVDALADHNEAVRACAKRLGKDNFFLPGEISGGNAYGSVYLGRGRQPDMLPESPAHGMNLTTKILSDVKNLTIRDGGKNALDSGAFHYSTYRYLTRFVGLSGNLEAGFDAPSNWVNMWNHFALTNDFVNPNTGLFDPRHMYGTMNQDVFRWSGITQGTERMILGFFITTLHLPGIPLVFYGEEQEFYVLDSTADNYIFGRQAFTPSQAWMMHGCYAGNSTQYINWPVDSARRGCEDPKNALDHRDPSHPVRNIMKSMYAMRDNYGTFRDAWLLQTLGNQTEFVLLEGSNETYTEFGIWSVVRAYQPTVQGQFASDPIWLVYHNRNETTDYTFDCREEMTAFYAPFDQRATVKNLFYPHDEITLGDSNKHFGFARSEENTGCLSKITMKPFEFRAYVETKNFVGPPPMITKFTPGHDAALNADEIKGSVDISLEFSAEMGCGSVQDAIKITSTVESGGEVKLTQPKCARMTETQPTKYVGSIPSRWRFTATLTNVNDGIHEIIVDKPLAVAGDSTSAVDHFFLRVGKPNNPVVFPGSANYSTTLVTKEGNDLFVNHAAAGADKWRYSTNWASSWSPWVDYKGGKDKISNLPWSGTPLQGWEGDHVKVQYWSKKLGSSSFRQEGDDKPQKERRFPHVFAHGQFNKFGFDSGLKNQLALTGDGKWELHLMAEWPTMFQLNIWGMNPDQKPDAGFVYGDVEGDGIVDRMPPSSLVLNVLNATHPPPMPALSYKLFFDDKTMRFTKEPQGNMWIQIIMFILMATLPIVGGLTAVWIFMGSFYKVKVNKIGFKKRGRSPFGNLANGLSTVSFENFRHKNEAGMELAGVPGKRRKVIIATMEYNIDDWNIKIKIGGLGVMAQLMGKALEHQDLIWVVPCVGGIDYPIDQRAEPMYVPIMGKEYEIEVQYHQVQNITYVLLDAPIFRQQSKADPYPPRMDDIDSAIYYSAWNYCIAETIRRFDPDLYHINDYHGAAAPLYLLPDRTIPCALSLHNAEFQGMWPMRNPEESKEVCEVFNLDSEIVKEYVQFCTVFNLLHAGASYLRVHQKGFGAVGVSKKYGDRSYARYPIFWGLSKIGQLPNPDPSDTAEWSRDEEVQEKDVVIDLEAESKRGDFRKQAQEWAGLEINPNAELFVFVGRWSLQKGVDLIADIVPPILEKYPNTQLIAIGPVIDLYGKFAALKLAKLMERYPKRVYSKPEFTSLPPYIFTGAEFALIPSRDEPFGLVAVEFGRKGALGVGARVGGLGQMPGFWYTVESTAPQHLLHQFREAIVGALECKPKTRQKMRAWSAKQRFPVAQWVEDLDILQGEAIRLHNKEAKKRKRVSAGSMLTVPSGANLGGGNSSRNFFDDSDVETPRQSMSRSRASSLAVPFITETDHDEDDSRRRSSSNPFYDQPGSGTPPLPTMSGTPPAPQQFAPPNPMFANQSAMSSVSRLMTIAANDPNQSRLSVDTLAMRMMSPDGFDAQPHAFGIYNNPRARPGGLEMYQNRNRNSSGLSVVDVVGDRHDFKLQNVDPFFTDNTGDYYKAFEDKLADLNSKNSETDLCIDDYLKASEKQWAKDFREAKLGRERSPSRNRDSALLIKRNRQSMAPSMISVDTIAPSEDEDYHDENQPGSGGRDDEFLLGEGYKPPTGLKKILSIRIGDWPVYSFILALGQIISANSYQIVLLAGEAEQTASQLYTIAGTYAVTSILWWFMFRRFTALYALSLPWFFYSLAFMMLGVTPFLPEHARGPVQNTASAMYAAAASSGALFFALNFGDEGGAPIMIWIFRAAVIQGIQLLYNVGLWFWGSLITQQNGVGLINGAWVAGKVPTVLVITLPIAVVLWAIGVISFLGLPDYYRQSPDTIPSFYMSLVRRHIVPWFFFYVVVQNFWLTTNYGRSWEFLLLSRALPSYAAVLLSLGFFTLLWAAALYAFTVFSRTHPWIVPLFAIGLGAPRWAQMLWGVSGIGLYLPWTGSAVASALISRCLWFWLGMLDNIQGVGIGMVLLLTLTRQHVAATLLAAQVLGASFTILARGTAPHKTGPDGVFPDFSEGALRGIAQPWFWVCLAMQLVLPVGFFKFFRKEQVAKP